MGSARLIAHGVEATALRTELECLEYLQGLEACGRAKDVTFDIPSSFSYPELITEFQFRHIKLVETASTPGHDGGAWYREAINDPFYLSRFIARASEHLGISGCQKREQLDFSRPVFFERHCRLGDMFCATLGLENYLAANYPDQTLDLAGDEIGGQVVELLGCKHVRYVPETRSKAVNLDWVFSLASWRTPWPERFNHALCQLYGGKPTFGLCFPEMQNLMRSRLPRGDIYCQFDTRSSDPQFIQYAPQFLERLLDDPLAVIVLGGPDTARYLGPTYRYEVGPVPFLVERLRSAALFIGCDSGIAHLAGLMHVPSIVINFTDIQPVLAFFRLYPETIVVDRRLFLRTCGGGGFTSRCS